MNIKRDSKRYYGRTARLNVFSEYEKSIVFCKRSLSTKSDCYQAHYLWGLSLVRKQENEKAARKFKELLIINPGDPRIYFHLGMIFERQSNLIEAETQYKKCLSLDSLEEDARQHLIMLLTRQCKYKEALEQSEKKIEIYPYESTASNNLGYLKFILGDYKEAIRNFEIAIEKGMQSRLALMNKILALYCLGRVEMAAKVWKEKFEDIGTGNLTKYLEANLKIYVKELNRFEGILESDDLRGGISKEVLVKNIEGFRFIIDQIKQSIRNTRSSRSRRRFSR